MADIRNEPSEIPERGYLTLCKAMNYPNFCKLLLAEVETANKRKGITAVMKPTVARNTWQEMTLYVVAIRFVNTLVVDTSLQIRLLRCMIVYEIRN